MKLAGTIFEGAVAVGELEALQRDMAARLLGFETGRPTSVTFEYGVTYTASAGLLNILVILDACDTARGLKP